MLTACPKALAEGHYRWRPDKVLAEIANWVEQQWVKANSNQAQPVKGLTFVRAGGKVQKAGMKAKTLPFILHRTSDWELDVELRKLVFPPDVAATSLQPGMVLLSRNTKTIVFAELTVPREERLDVSH